MSIYSDQLDRKIEVKYPPKKIISLVPSITELLYDLNLEKETIGITKFCEFPSHWRKEKTIIGGTKNINIEKIKALHPDLIIANKEENDKLTVEELSNHFPVWISDIKNYQDGIEMIEKLSILLDKKRIGNVWLNRIQRAKEVLLNETNANQKLKVAYVIWKDPIMVAGGDTYISDMLKLSGVENIFSQQTRYPTVDKEALQKADPDIILLSSEPFPFKQKDFPVFENICPNAVIKLVDGTYFSWYGSRMLPAIKYFHKFREEIYTDA